MELTTCVSETNRGLQVQKETYYDWHKLCKCFGLTVRIWSAIATEADLGPKTSLPFP